jgi:hypothetical protein
MNHLGYVFIVFGFLFLGISSVSFWIGQEIIRKPIVISQFELEPESLRLLSYLYILQVKNDLHKMIIFKNGSFSEKHNGIDRDINIIQDFFNLQVKGDILEKNVIAFEKLIFKIPVTYLRNIPETRIGSPYVLSVTQEGIAYLKSKSKI